MTHLRNVEMICRFEERGVEYVWCKIPRYTWGLDNIIDTSDRPEKFNTMVFKSDDLICSRRQITELPTWDEYSGRSNRGQNNE